MDMFVSSGLFPHFRGYVWCPVPNILSLCREATNKAESVSSLQLCVFYFSPKENKGVLFWLSFCCAVENVCILFTRRLINFWTWSKVLWVLNWNVNDFLQIKHLLMTVQTASHRPLQTWLKYLIPLFFFFFFLRKKITQKLVSTLETDVTHSEFSRQLTYEILNDLNRYLPVTPSVQIISVFLVAIGLETQMLLQPCEWFRPQAWTSLWKHKFI